MSTVFKPLIKGLLNHGKYLDKGFVERLQSLFQGQETVSEDRVADKDQNQEQDNDQNTKTLSGKHDFDPFFNFVQQSQAIEVLEFLNQKTGKAYRPVEANLKLIMARLHSGATVMDCRQVIAKKTREWRGNPKMEEYLRPATLFNATKFEQYVGELVIPKMGVANDAN